MPNHRIGLIVLTRDRQGMLDEMLDSIRMQSYREYSCIVLDNGSSDATVANVRTRSEQDSRFEVRTWHACSAEKNFQRAIDIGSSDFDWFAMLHDDDRLDVDWLKRAMEGVLAHPRCAMVNVNALTFASDTGEMGRIWYHDFSGQQTFLPDQSALARWMIRYGSLHFPSTLYRGEMLLGWTLTNPYGKCSDQYFLMELARNGGVYVVGDPLYHYRIHAGQDSTTMDESLILSLQAYIDSHLSWKFHPVVMIERNRNLLKLFRHFRAVKDDFSPAILAGFLWKWKILLIDAKEIMRLMRALRAWIDRSRTYLSKR